jgi:capsular polysaccharide export protein
MIERGLPADRRSFLFLQGPPGPLFHRLAAVLRERDIYVHRVNICGGDRADWPDKAVNFRQRFTDWPVFVDRFLRQEKITDILLFGDCRPFHVVARRIASMRGIRTHVLEEGYLRPHWMTFELEGVNAHSRLQREKNWFLEQARGLPDDDALPPVTASFRRRARDATRHYTAVHLGALAYPHYRTHRSVLPVVEGLGWIWKYAVGRARERAAERVVADLSRKRFFLLPLQLSGDYQIRSHSPFPTMPAAAEYVLESFAAHAPPDAHLLVKTHPLDCSFFNWKKFVLRRARKLGVADRVHYADGGDLEELAAETAGMICVNSTSATLALQVDTPVCVLGEAIYKVPGLVFDGHVDDFWIDPPPPEPGLYEAFRRVLLRECLIRGGLASESAVTTLVASMTEKLLERAPRCEGSPANQSSTLAKCAAHEGGLKDAMRSSCA